MFRHTPIHSTIAPFRNCLHRFSSEEQLLATIRLLVKDLVSAHFNESVFAVGAEVSDIDYNVII